MMQDLIVEERRDRRRVEEPEDRQRRRERGDADPAEKRHHDQQRVEHPRLPDNRSEAQEHDHAEDRQDRRGEHTSEGAETGDVGGMTLRPVGGDAEAFAVLGLEIRVWRLCAKAAKIAREMPMENH